MNNIIKHNVYNQSCIEGMKEHVKDNTIDLIFTDPPYGIKGDKLDVLYHRDESFVVPGYVDIPLDEYAKFSQDWINECYRVLRPGGTLYIVSGYTNLHHILNALHNTELVEINHIIAKYSFGISTKRKFVASHYHILFWQKPDKDKQIRTFNTYCRYTDQKDSYHDRLSNQNNEFNDDFTDIISESEYDRLSIQTLPRDYKPGQIKNKNQLSEGFIEKFILYSSNRGDRVLDCFGGGLTTGKAALRYGRKFTGFEINTNAVNAFEPMLSQVKELSDPIPIPPEDEELKKRVKLRDGWRKKREERKKEKLSIVEKENKMFNVEDKVNHIGGPKGMRTNISFVGEQFDYDETTIFTIETINDGMEAMCSRVDASGNKQYNSIPLHELKLIQEN